MREIKRTDNGLIDHLLRTLEATGTQPVKNTVQVGASHIQKNIVGTNIDSYPTIVSNDITLSNIFNDKGAK